MRNILFEVSPLHKETLTPTTLRMCAANDHSSEVVVNGHFWHPIIKESPKFRFSIFSDGEVSPFDIQYSDVGIIISRKTGTENWANEYFFDGAPGKIWFGEGDNFADYTLWFDGTVGPLGERVNQVSKITLLGKEAALDSDLLTAFYEGTGGYEGELEIAGTLKPWLSGTCDNVDPIRLDPEYQIYQVHGYGAVQEISMVYSNAVELGAPKSDVASYEALLGLALIEGEWATCLARGMFRLGADPTNARITADVKGAKDGSTYNGTIGSIAQQLIRWAGVSGSDIDASTFAPFTQEVGIYRKEQVSIKDAVREIFGPAGYFFAGTNGKWKAGSYYATKTPIKLHHGDFRTDPAVIEVKQLGAPPPVYRVRIGCDRTWYVHGDNEISPLFTEVNNPLDGYLDQDFEWIVADDNGDVDPAEFALHGGTFHVTYNDDDITGNSDPDHPVVYSVGEAVNCSVTINPTTGVYVPTALTADKGWAVLLATVGSATYAETYTMGKAKDGINAKLIVLAATKRTIRYDGEGNPDPVNQTITFGLQRQNMTGTATWTLTDREGVTKDAATYLSGTTGDGPITMTETQFAAASAGTGGIVVRVDVADPKEPRYDWLDVIAVYDGIDGESPFALTGNLSNENDSVAADANGVVSSYAGLGGIFQVFANGVEVTSDCVFSTALETNVDCSINPTTGEYSPSSMTADQGFAIFHATYTDPDGNVYDPIEKQYTITKQKAGTDGTPAKFLKINCSATYVLFHTVKNEDDEDVDEIVPGQSNLTFSATKTGTTGLVTWALTDLNGVTKNAATYLSATTGDSVTMTLANFQAACGDTLGIKIAISTPGAAGDSQSIVLVKNGRDGLDAIPLINGFLSSPFQQIRVDGLGEIIETDYNTLGGHFNVYEGSELVSDEPGVVVFTKKPGTETGGTIVLNADSTYWITSITAAEASCTFVATYKGKTIERTVRYGRLTSPGSLRFTYPHNIHYNSAGVAFPYQNATWWLGMDGGVLAETVDFDAFKVFINGDEDEFDWENPANEYGAALIRHTDSPPTEVNQRAMIYCEQAAFDTILGVNGIAIKVVATALYQGVVYQDEAYIYKVQDGAAGIPGVDGTSPLTAQLSKPTVTLSASNAGVVGSYSAATSEVRILEGSTDVTSNFTLATQTNAQSLTVTYGNGSNPRTLSVTGAGSSSGQFGNGSVDSASLVVRATGSGSYAGKTVDFTFGLTKAKNGLDGSSGVAGQNGIVAALRNPSTTLPATSTGSVTSWATGESEVIVMSGTTDVSGSFFLSTYANPNGFTVTYNNSSNPRSFEIIGASTSSGNFGHTGTDLGVLRVYASGTAGIYSGTNFILDFTVSKSKAGTTGTNGSDGTDAKLMFVIADRQNIKFNGAGVRFPSSQTTTFTAQKQNTTAQVTWSITRLSGASVSIAYLSNQFGNSVTMTGADFESACGTEAGIIVTGSITDGSTITDKVSLLKVQDGQGSIVATDTSIVKPSTSSSAGSPTEMAIVTIAGKGTGGSFKLSWSAQCTHTGSSYTELRFSYEYRLVGSGTWTSAGSGGPIYGFSPGETVMPGGGGTKVITAPSSSGDYQVRLVGYESPNGQSLNWTSDVFVVEWVP